jgi:hypothetical protein
MARKRRENSEAGGAPALQVRNHQNPAQARTTIADVAARSRSRVSPASDLAACLKVVIDAAPFVSGDIQL